tara:strand:+ start:754 stop:1164 length:411 start_codon:yes stop_codon:yes gene_type:complete
MMRKEYLKKIIAQSFDDLKIISACCSGAKVRLSQIKFLKNNKIFLVYLKRLNREGENTREEINSVIRFEYIDSSKSKNIDQNNPELELELIAIDLFKKNHNFEIILLFSKNRIITLNAEIIEVTLEDQKISNDESS